MRGRRAGLALWLVVASLIQTGCGYSSGELFPDDVRTVAVPIFENKSFYRGVEFDLTEALVKEIELRTPYKVTGTNRADTIIRGTITSVSQSRLSRQSIGGVPQELEVHVMVDFEWKDLRSGQTLRQREGFESVGRYMPAAPVSEPLEVGQHEAVARMARAVVSVMAGDW